MVPLCTSNILPPLGEKETYSGLLRRSVNQPRESWPLRRKAWPIMRTMGTMRKTMRIE